MRILKAIFKRCDQLHKNKNIIDTLSMIEHVVKGTINIAVMPSGICIVRFLLLVTRSNCSILSIYFLP